MFKRFFTNVGPALQNGLVVSAAVAAVSAPPAVLGGYLAKREDDATECYEAEQRALGYRKVQTGYTTDRHVVVYNGNPVVQTTKKPVYEWHKADDTSGDVETMPYCRR